MSIFVVEQDGAGGPAHYAYQLCQALNGAGADVTVVTGQHYELADLSPTFLSASTRRRSWRLSTRLAGNSPRRWTPIVSDSTLNHRSSKATSGATSTSANWSIATFFPTPPAT